MTRENLIWLEETDELPVIRGTIYVAEDGKKKYVVTVTFGDWRDVVRIQSPDPKLFLKFNLDLERVEEVKL